MECGCYIYCTDRCCCFCDAAAAVSAATLPMMMLLLLLLLPLPLPMLLRLILRLLPMLPDAAHHCMGIQIKHRLITDDWHISLQWLCLTTAPFWNFIDGCCCIDFVLSNRFHFVFSDLHKTIFIFSCHLGGRWCSLVNGNSLSFFRSFFPPSQSSFYLTLLTCPIRRRIWSWNQNFKISNLILHH